MMDVIGIGRALVDGYTKDEKYFPFFEKLLGKIEEGRIYRQLTFNEVKMLLETFPSSIFTQGGSVANTIRISQEMGKRNTFVGTIGNDINGKIFVSEMKKFGVNLIVDRVDEYTGLTFIAYYPLKRARIALSYYGASNYLKIDETVEKIPNHKILYLSCYEFIPPLTEKISSVLENQKVKRSKNMKTINLGGCANPVLSDKINKLAELLYEPYFDIIIGNEKEYQTFFKNSSEEDIIEKVKKISKISVITSDKCGSTVIYKDKVCRIPVYGEIIKGDIVGVGDAYAAGFINSLLEGKNPLIAGYIGSYYAYLFINRKDNVLVTI